MKTPVFKFVLKCIDIWVYLKTGSRPNRFKLVGSTFKRATKTGNRKFREGKKIDLTCDLNLTTFNKTKKLYYK